MKTLLIILGIGIVYSLISVQISLLLSILLSAICILAIIGIITLQEN